MEEKNDVERNKSAHNIIQDPLLLINLLIMAETSRPDSRSVTRSRKPLTWKLVTSFHCFPWIFPFGMSHGSPYQSGKISLV